MPTDFSPDAVNDNFDQELHIFRTAMWGDIMISAGGLNATVDRLSLSEGYPEGPFDFDFRRSEKWEPLRENSQ